MSSVKIAFVAGLALLAIAIDLTLLASPTSVARMNRAPSQPPEPVTSTSRSATYCQAHEVLPRDTSAIRIWIDAFSGPRVRVVVSSGGRPITSGERGSGWIGGSVTIPVTPLPRAVPGATVCVSFQLQYETIIVQGNLAPATIAAREGPRTLSGKMWIEYLRSGTRSWASLAPEVARHMGFGRAAAGTWIVFLALALLAAVVGLASNLVLRELP